MTAKERALSDFFSALRDDAYFMKEALTEARKAFEEDEVPIGAVIVSGEEIIGRGYNRTEALSDVTAHAEMLAITAAQNALGSKVLPDCTLFVTVEPCVMCAGAMRWARLKKVVWGCDEPKVGFTALASPKILHPKTEIVRGVLAEEASLLMRAFFRKRR